MLRYGPIASRDRVSDDARCQRAAAVRKRCHGVVVIAQVRVASEETMAGAEAPVEPGIELLLVFGLGGCADVIVCRSRQVGRGIALHDEPAEGVETAGGDCIVRERLSR